MVHPPIPLIRIPAGKIAVPELPVEFTPRTPLRRLLDEATDGQVVVVSAPAGSGKTLLLADWVRTDVSRETAWVSVGADDDEPRRLWSAVVTALLALPSAGADGRLQRVAALATLQGGADVVESLADALDTLDSPVRIVLDDVHELTGREVLRDLTRLIRCSPARLQLVIAGRVDPPISVPRLRLEGRLHEVRADALRFTVDDSATLLRTAGLDLTPGQVADLHARTEGWAAGLRLAALALRRSDDPAAFLTSFSGDERSVAEYLTGEILDGLSPDTQDFLRAVSVCSPLPAALAAELSGRPDAAWLLDELGQTTALVESTLRAGHRIHPLLRSYLVAELARHQPETYRMLQRVAARWWSVREQPVHALRHAERAGDRALVAALVQQSGVALLLAGALGPLRRALAALGPDARAADPWLSLIAALTHLEARALPAATTELRNARRAWPETPSAELDALRQSAEFLAAGQGLEGESPPQLSERAARIQPELTALLHASLGAAEFGNSAGPDVALARTHLTRALELAREIDLGYLEVQSLSMLATLAGMRGNLREMVVIAEEAVASATRQGRHPSAWTSASMGILAYADLLGGRPAAAAARAEEALTSWELSPPESAYTLRAVHGAATADLGRRPAGLAEMRAARTDFHDTLVPTSMVAALALLEHRAALFNGNLGAASEVATWLGARVQGTGENLLLKAWTEAATGRHDAAATTVAPVVGSSVPILLPQSPLEAQLLVAEAALQAGDRATGRAALERALADGEAIGVARPFALAGPRTQELLTARATANGRGPFPAQVSAARATVRAVPAVLLSEREEAVLGLLPSLLNAREIADEFTVSVNTVKSHIRSIYAKLGVSSRREAVRHAQDRGLLP
jgi:LuxR family maltose regulon positive regulatory protein